MIEILNTIIGANSITTAYTSKLGKSLVWQACEEVVNENLAKEKNIENTVAEEEQKRIEMQESHKKG